jgi:hypothetical protein
MSNSIIDQQRDNEDFQPQVSPFNGMIFTKNYFTGQWPKEYYSDAIKYRHQPDPLPDLFKINVESDIVKKFDFGPDLAKQALRDNPESDMYKKLKEMAMAATKANSPFRFMHK